MMECKTVFEKHLNLTMKEIVGFTFHTYKFINIVEVNQHSSLFVFFCISFPTTFYFEQSIYVACLKMSL